ncbi:MAG: ketoacid-CoA transferase [Candidatus Aminicenantes bacterium]|nr:ketoacid-CoA transferase [Candidatus Aminicenantes bacterium]NIM81343.1 ketoacid-CoA transferase [Candidatus Aminicenantes bacterium]NIN20754.1 ketoacid-CoA transferase [Candidatus Aminicenantes bacterium]NIN44532.1 ketoacid-CoA transferase [Candidatus Aminicenantes bacterium]NIN87352.1 ketoacid-CoA transferase [Candidatus Aminicenantes bacterium]
MNNNTYTSRELMAIAAAREIHDGDIVFCGTGISLLAAMAAKYIHAPKSIIFFETGAIDPDLREIPLTVADPRLMFGSCVNAGLAEAFATMQNRFLGPRLLGILGAAQVDRFGNLNSTCIGDYTKPNVRFPGSGGACDVGSFVGRTMVFIKHERRRFVEKLDYFTTPGYVDGPGGRERQGYKHGGPSCVISDKAVMRFDEVTKEMVLDRFYPGTTPEEIQCCTGFSIDICHAKELLPPTVEELDILRRQVDPQRLIL